MENQTDLTVFIFYRQLLIQLDFVLLFLKHIISPNQRDEMTRLLDNHFENFSTTFLNGSNKTNILDFLD